MTGKKALLIVLAVFMTLTVVMNASAEWYTCRVIMVGVNYNSPAVRLTHSSSAPAFTNTWFRLAGPSTKEMLATALTALSMGKNVLVNAQGTTAFSDITGIYVAP